MLISPPTLKEIRRQAKALRCQRSLSEFTRTFWPIVEPGTPLVWGWHLDAVCDHLQAVSEGKIRNLIICIPPGHAKSTCTAVMWPAWEWTTNPYERTLFGSYEEQLALRDAGKCREVIRSSRYQGLFHPVWEIKKEKDSLGYFENTLQGARKCYFMTSRKKTGWRGNKVVVDDPLSAEDRYDKLVKAACIETWNKVLSTRVNDLDKAAFVIIMQRLAEDDLVGYIKEHYGDKYEWLILPAEFNPKRKCVTSIWQDPRTEEGQLLFPERFSHTALNDLRTNLLGPVDYSAQFQHDPIPEAGSRFDSRYFQFWEYTDVPNVLRLKHRSGKIEYVRIDMCNKFVTADLACTEDKLADFTSIGLWASTPTGSMLLLDRKKVKEEEPGVLEAIKSVYSSKQFGDLEPHSVFLEKNGLGKPIAQESRWTKGLPVVEVGVSRDKVTLSAHAIVRIQGGQMFFPDHSIAPWMVDFQKEMTSFPNGIHDDDVTMVSLAANSYFAFKTSEISGTAVGLNGHTPPSLNPNRITANLARHNLFGGLSSNNGHLHRT